MNLDLIVLSLYILLLASIAFMVLHFEAQQKKLSEELYIKEMEEEEFAELEEEVPSSDETEMEGTRPAEPTMSSPVDELPSQDEMILRQRLRHAQTVLA